MPFDFNDMIVKIINEDDIWFNLISLKQKLLVQKPMCENCHTRKENWTINGKCHHTICQDCIDSFVHSKNTCPKCKIQFNSEVDISTSLDLKLMYTEIEQTVWKTIALRPMDSSLSTETLQENHNSELSVPHLSTILSNDEIEVIQHSESANSEFNKDDDFPLVQLTLAENEIALIINSNTDERNNLNYELRADHTVGNDSEDDIIDGTPEKSINSYPMCSTSGDNVVSSKRIILSHSNLNSENLEFVKKFVDFFKVELNSSLDDSVTHLVVQTAKDNTCKRTRKYLNALLSHCCIVSMNWIKDCLLHEKLMPEIGHIPVDSSTQQAALMAWQTGKGHIKSPMEWTKDCILYFHSSVVQSHSEYPHILALAKKANFVVADRLEEFNDQFKLRFILLDLIKDEDEDEIITQINKHNALPLRLDWLIECLGQYRCVPISSEYQVLSVDEEFLEFVNMDKSYFVLNG